MDRLAAGLGGCERRRWPLLIVATLVSFAACAVAADKNTSTEPGEAVIRASAETFVNAFNRGDAKAVAALWTVNGTEADENGAVFKGRKSIEEQYAALFKSHPDAQIDIAIRSIDFVAPGVAVEDGVATITPKTSGAPTASHYTAIHVLEDGQWLMASVRESHIDVSSNYQALMALEWLIGKWETKQDDVELKSDVRWLGNKSFIQRDYSARKDGVAVSSGMQIIGVDPQSGQIRSWSFDSSGGHGAGLWTATPDGWRIDHRGVLANGTPTASRDLIIRVPGENDVFGWRSTDRHAGDVSLQNTREVVLERIAQKR